MLIYPGEKKDRPSAFAVPTGNHIGQHLFVSVADMGRRIRVIDRRGNEKSVSGHK